MPYPLSEIKQYLDAQFVAYPFQDYSNNGLQVEGSPKIQKIAFAVDACQQTIDKAKDTGAQMLIVHHGISWGDGFKRITGIQGTRIRTLIHGDISLYAMHLPLDAHTTIGNNAILAKMLGIRSPKGFSEYQGIPIGCQGCLPEKMSLADLAAKICGLLHAPSAAFNFRHAPVLKIGIVSGSGADAIEEAAELKLDALLTGEIRHQDFHNAEEYKIDILQAGHYATETTGVTALMKQMQQDKKECEYVFLDLPTGL